MLRDLPSHMKWRFIATIFLIHLTLCIHKNFDVLLLQLQLSTCDASMLALCVAKIFAANQMKVVRFIEGHNHGW